MPRRKTSRYKKRAMGPRKVDLKPRSGRVLWCETKRAGMRFAKYGIFLVVLGVGGFFGKQALEKVFLENPEFNLKLVDLRQWDGEEEPELMNLARVVEVTGLDPKASIFAFKLSELEEKLAALPEVKRVRATRRLPNVVRISIEERVPVAWLDSPRHRVRGRDFYRGVLVDAEGFCFRASPAMGEAVEDLPVISAGEREAGRIRSGEVLQEREMLRALELVKTSKRYLEGSGWSLP
ncbi:MAG: FtsQ-type POTRA domain-containing protein, partial [Verrucomicrobiota bacterium]